MFSKTIVTLASSLAMVMVAGSSRTLADPAPEFRLAQTNLPNIQITPVVPRPPTLRPRARVPIDKDRLRRESGQDQAPAVTAPPGVKPNTARAPNRTSAPEFVGLPKPRLEPADDAAESLSRLADRADIKGLKEHIEALQATLNIARLVGPPNASAIGGWGAGAGEDGNQNSIPGGNGGGAAGNPVEDAAGRAAAGAGPDHGDLGMDLLGRVTEGLNSGEKMGGAVTTAPSPGQALGGIASRLKVVRRVVGPWEFDPLTQHDRQVTTTYYNDNSYSVTQVTHYHNRTWSVASEHFDEHGRRISRTYVPPATEENPEKGSGTPGKSDDGAGEAGKKIEPGKDIAKTQDPYSGGGVIAWIPPSCGSAECNAIRDYLRNPKGAIGQVMDKGNRVLGDRGADPGAGSGHQLRVDQHGLVVLYGPDSGPPAGGGGGRVERFDPSKFRSD
ncbi:MAG: hypothetical protein OEL78_05665 [Hyphomicrobiales bacterium]|nr:hypothetical protein [Hyphomicrobiales bacterium]